MSSRLPLPLRRSHAWAASVLWMAVIFGLSSLPGGTIPSRGGTLGHFAVYTILGGLLFVAFLHETPTPGRVLAYAVLAASAYGVTDEFHQHFVPGRVPDAYDWGVNTLSALFGAALAWGVLDRVSRRRARFRG